MKQQHRHLTSHRITVNRNLERSVVGGIRGIQSRKRRTQKSKVTSHSASPVASARHSDVTSSASGVLASMRRASVIVERLRPVFRRNIFVYQKPMHLYSRVIYQFFMNFMSYLSIIYPLFIYYLSIIYLLFMFSCADPALLLTYQVRTRKKFLS